MDEDDELLPERPNHSVAVHLLLAAISEPHRCRLLHDHIRLVRAHLRARHTATSAQGRSRSILQRAVGPLQAQHHDGQCSARNEPENVREAQQQREKGLVVIESPASHDDP